MASTDRLGVSITGLAIKTPVAAATTAAITLSGEQTIDGYAATENDRILVKDQADATDNGIYLVSAGNWSRSGDANGNTEWGEGVFMLVLNGTTNANTFWQLTTDDDPVVIGTSELDFGRIVVTAESASFDTRTAAASATIVAGLNHLRTAGYATMGDGGGALYEQVGGTTLGGFQSADGAWWAIADTVVSAKSFGAKGDGVTDDTDELQDAIDLCFTTFDALVFGPDGYAQRKLFIPAGNYLISSPLVLDGKWGATIYGAGKFSTTIRNDVAGTGVFTVNGARDMIISGMSLNGEVGGSENVFDLSWDGASFINTTENILRDMNISDGGRGLYIHGSQSDITQIEFVNFGGHSIAGIKVLNANNLGHSVIGCQFQDCAIGIHVGGGSIPVISGCQFQISADWDIVIDGSANDTYLISGCRSEQSDNFVKIHRGNVHLSGCSHLGTNNGTFVETGYHPVTITACISTKGQITGDNVAVSPFNFATIDGCEFGRTDWNDGTVICAVTGTAVGTTLDVAPATTILRDGVYNEVFVPRVRIQALTDQASIATDAELGNTFTVTLGGNRTLENPTNLPTGVTGNGGLYTWIVTQDGTGGRTLAFGNMFKWSPGSTTVAPQLNLTPGAVNVITARWDGTTLWASVASANPSLTLKAPVTVTDATYSVLASDYSIIANRAGTVTLTLQSAVQNPGRILRIKTIQAQTVVSASSNVVPIDGGAAGTAILAGTAGLWADLQSDGTNWIIMAAK